MPEEEVLVGGDVQLVEEGLGATVGAEAVDDEELHLVVDLASQVGFLLMVGDAEVVLDEAVQVALVGVGVESEGELRRGGGTAHGTAGDAAEVEAVEALDKAVALHKLVVEVGQRFRLFGIHHDAEPEAEAGDVDGTTLDVDTVDVVLDDFFLQLAPAVFVSPARCAREIL